MSSKKPDPNRAAFRLVKRSTKESTTPPKGLEAAWEAWAKRIQRVDDERTWTLLRAAFEAGYEAKR
jgi:hypothetical protein